MERKETATAIASKEETKRAEEQQEEKCPVQGKQPSPTLIIIQMAWKWTWMLR